MVTEAIPMDLAPVDNTMIRLLVEWTPGADVWAPLTDDLRSWTFGFNGFRHTEEDVWQYVGWSWSQDCFHDCRTDQGWPKPIGWLPIVGPSTEQRADGASGDGGLATLAAERDRALAALYAMRAVGPVEAADNIVAFMDGAVGVVEATRAEYCSLYLQAKGRQTWHDNLGGYGVTVGWLAGKPVCISLLFAHVDGHKLLFIHDTSAVVDHDLIRAWLDKNAPKTAFRDDGRLNMTDATNFGNVFPRAAFATQEKPQGIPSGKEG